MDLTIYHGIEDKDFEYGVVQLLYLFVFFSNKYIQEVISF